jgi:Tol biopolymer transport system component
MKHFIYLISITGMLLAATPPLSFIALEDDTWSIVVCEDMQHCQAIQTEQEPRTYDYNFQNGDLVYIASDKSVRVIHNQTEKLIIQSEKDAYTEPSFINGGIEIMLVQLIDGNSKKTKVITTDLNGIKVHTLVSQYSTALEPYSPDGEQIYYANVSCVDGCGKIIQEIWHKDTTTGVANQLTLLNTLSHQPRLDKEKKMIYFSSAKAGNYHIWKYDLKNRSVEQVTFGDVTDGFPSPYKDGLLFLRRTGNKVTLMQLGSKGDLQELKLHKAYQKIRNLKVKQ